MKSKRAYLGLIWGLILLGFVLLIAWVFSVGTYGFEVDERGLAPEVRGIDVALFAGGLLCFIAAIVIPILRHRRSPADKTGPIATGAD